MPQKAVKVRVGPLIPVSTIASATRSRAARSFHFTVDRALPVMTAELFQLQLLRHGLPVLGRRVIPTFALGALQRDDFSSLSRHLFLTLDR